MPMLHEGVKYESAVNRCITYSCSGCGVIEPGAARFSHNGLCIPVPDGNRRSEVQKGEGAIYIGGADN